MICRVTLSLVKEEIMKYFSVWFYNKTHYILFKVTVLCSYRYFLEIQDHQESPLVQGNQLDRWVRLHLVDLENQVHQVLQDFHEVQEVLLLLEVRILQGDQENLLVQVDQKVLSNLTINEKIFTYSYQHDKDEIILSF